MSSGPDCIQLIFNNLNGQKSLLPCITVYFNNYWRKLWDDPTELETKFTIFYTEEDPESLNISQSDKSKDIVFKTHEVSDTSNE